MTEQIGKVILDKTLYPGRDLYCDGVVEDELLAIARDHQPEEFDRIIEQRAEWPLLYHLSSKRANIVEWLPVESGAKVLEVGSGCGAITGTLAEMAGSVTCIDLSAKRSAINAYRNRDKENILIHVGNFKDIEKVLPEDYDYIFLIGVFEYGQAYMDSKTPYEDFLSILKKHLKPGGRMVIAIENLWGLKYWAGCREDHLGTYFSGLEGYPADAGVRTFTRRGLEELMQKTGISEYHFYYPYPDYKFMTTLYSDDRLPNVGELSNNIRNFDRERMLLFDEKHVFDNIIKENLFPLYSNSYLVVIGPGVPDIYVRYSNDRSPEYAIKTEIYRTEDGELQVAKSPLGDRADPHLEQLCKVCRSLEQVFTDGKTQVNACVRSGNRLTFHYVEGKTLEEYLDEAMEHRDTEAFAGFIRRYVDVVRRNETAEWKDRDLIFSNIIVEQDVWNIIDYEWSSGTGCEVERMVTRALYCYTLGSHRRKLFVEEHAEELAALGYSVALLPQIIQQEVAFQARVAGDGISMTSLREKIGMRVINPQTMDQRPGVLPRIQIYTNTGSGFSEEQSYFLPQDSISSVIDVKVQWPKGTVQLRFDPCMEPVLGYIREISVEEDGKSTVLQAFRPNPKGRYRAGRMGYYTNADAVGGDFYSFHTSDPNIVIQYKTNRDAILHVRMELLKLPELMAEQRG